MVAAPFGYQRVTSFQEAARALRERGEDAKVLAGGQSLVPMLNLRVARPAWLVDINPVGAGPITEDGGWLRLPALTRHRAVEADELVRRRCPMLAAAAARIGNVRTRTRGTVGGSLAHADPAAELPCVAVALGAEVTVQGPDGTRDLPAGDLLVSYLTTTLAPDEVIAEVRVPTLGPRAGWSFQELCRRSGDWMVVGVAALVELDAGGQVAAASVTFGGVAERPWQVPAEVLADLVGAPPAGERLAPVAEAAAAMLDPDDDVHASGAYRRRMAAVLGRRALAEAAARAGGNGDGRRGSGTPTNAGGSAPHDPPGPGAPMTQGKRRVAFTVNGEPREAWVDPHDSLLDVLHDGLGHHEVRYGCGEGVCGTCTVLLDGEPVSGCLLLAVQADGCDLLTVRGLAPDGGLHPLQACFLRNGAAQCGFCTPGMLLTAWALLQREPRPSRERIRQELTGNLCRCTGYSKILDAVEEHAREATARG